MFVLDAVGILLLKGGNSLCEGRVLDVGGTDLWVLIVSQDR